MLIRDCAGGIVFCHDQVLLIQNDKGEWGFPKGSLAGDAGEVEEDDLAVWRVQKETGVQARIIARAGKTNYEFYSLSRKRPVANRISWFVMTCDLPEARANQSLGICQAKFFPFDQARDLVTYSQDKSLLLLAYQKYLDLSNDGGDED